MADTILLDYIAGSLRNKSTPESTKYAATVLSKSAASLNLLHVDGPNHEALAELCFKAKTLSHSKIVTLKCAGLEIISAFASEGSTRMFLSEFPTWAGDALTVLKASLGGQQSPQEQDVQRAAWKLLTAIFKRISQIVNVPGVRRDGAAIVPALPALALRAISIEAPSGTVPSMDAFRALHAALVALPSAFRHHYKQLEQPLAELMLTGLSGSGSSWLAADAAMTCFATLPRIAGDSDTWSATVQRLLATAHALLDKIYLDLEPQGAGESYYAKQAIDPGAIPLALPATSDDDKSREGGSLRAYLASYVQFSRVIGCLQTLLSSPYPCPVPIPSHAILLLARRSLSVDASSLGSHLLRASAATGGQLAELCLHVADVHVAMLNLLHTSINVCGTQMMPLVGSAARVLCGQLDRVVGALSSGAVLDVATPPPAVRTALYATVAVLLQSAGLAGAQRMGASLLGCAGAELYGSNNNNSNRNRALTTTYATSQSQPPRKKTKRGSSKALAVASASTTADLVQGGGPDTNAGAASEGVPALGCQVEVLGALEVLLSRGGGVLPRALRSRADDVAAHVASTVTDAILCASQDAERDVSGLMDLQLAAYKTLLASVLTPAQHRPSHLPLALRLFASHLRHHDGRIASFCSTALLSCEALLHPRSMPLPVSPPNPGVANSCGNTANASDQGEGGVPLGMPRFWSYADAVGARAERLQQAVGLGGTAHGDTSGGGGTASGNGTAVGVGGGGGEGGRPHVPSDSRGTGATPNDGLQEEMTLLKERHAEKELFLRTEEIDIHTAAAMMRKDMDKANEGAPAVVPRQEDDESNTNPRGVTEPGRTAKPTRDHLESPTLENKGMGKPSNRLPEWKMTMHTVSGVVQPMPAEPSMTHAQVPAGIAPSLMQGSGSESELSLPEIDSGESGDEEDAMHDK